MTKLAIKSSDKKSDSEVDKMSKIKKRRTKRLWTEVPYSQLFHGFQWWFGKLSTISDVS